MHDDTALAATIHTLPAFLDQRAKVGTPVKLIVIDSIAFHFRVSRSLVLLVVAVASSGVEGNADAATSVNMINHFLLYSDDCIKLTIFFSLSLPVSTRLTPFSVYVHYTIVSKQQLSSPDQDTDWDRCLSVQTILGLRFGCGNDQSHDDQTG